MYSPQIGKSTRAAGFGKAVRLVSKTGTSTPGPKYEMSGTLGSQLTRSSSPACKIGHAERFTEKEYLSAAHAKYSQKSSSDCQVGPATYQSANPQQGPSYSFGSQDADRPRFNDKLFISRSHAKASGFGSNGPGPQPTITKHTLYGCNVESSSRCKRSPQVRFAGGDFSTEGNAKHKSESNETPGPGVYDPEVRSVKEKAPAYTFGVHGESSKRFAGPSRSADLSSSPGPGYHPDHTSVQRSAPSFSFGNPDPEEETKSRFDSNRYIGPGISTTFGTSSPGPAVYDSVNFSGGPAFTMGQKERLLMKRICPAPDKPRFISNELAKENYGCYSPGPKYALTSTMGSGVGYTFGTQDRSFEGYDEEQRSKLGTADKPYTSPAEARYISKHHTSVLKGKYSPGPKYSPRDTLNRTVTSNGTTVVRYNVAIESEKKTAPAFTIGTKMGSKSIYDSREYNPVEKLTMQSAPGYSFSSASRHGVGPCSQVEVSGKSTKGESQDKRLIESSPGPGAFKPNHSSVESHVPSVSLGGLSSSYNTQQCAAVKRPRTTSPNPTKKI